MRLQTWNYSLISIRSFCILLPVALPISSRYNSLMRFYFLISLLSNSQDSRFLHENSGFESRPLLSRRVSDHNCSRVTLHSPQIMSRSLRQSHFPSPSERKTNFFRVWSVRYKTLHYECNPVCSYQSCELLNLGQYGLLDFSNVSCFQIICCWSKNFVWLLV